MFNTPQPSDIVSLRQSWFRHSAPNFDHSGIIVLDHDRLYLVVGKGTSDHDSEFITSLVLSDRGLCWVLDICINVVIKH